MKTPGSGDALLVVDVQNDFLPGGALGVQHGDEVVQPLNRLIGKLPIKAINKALKHTLGL